MLLPWVGEKVNFQAQWDVKPVTPASEKAETVFLLPYTSHWKCT